MCRSVLHQPRRMSECGFLRRALGIINQCFPTFAVRADMSQSIPVSSLVQLVPPPRDLASWVV